MMVSSTPWGVVSPYCASHQAYHKGATLVRPEDYWSNLGVKYFQQVTDWESIKHLQIKLEKVDYINRISNFMQLSMTKEHGEWREIIGWLIGWSHPTSPHPIPTPDPIFGFSRRTGDVWPLSPETLGISRVKDQSRLDASIENSNTIFVYV